MDFEIEIESATSHEDIRNKGKAPARMFKVYRSNARRSCCHVCHIRHVTDHVVSTWHRSTNHRRDRHQQNLAHAKRSSHIFASKPAAASKLNRNERICIRPTRPLDLNRRDARATQGSGPVEETRPRERNSLERRPRHGREHRTRSRLRSRSVSRQRHGENVRSIDTGRIEGTPTVIKKKIIYIYMYFIFYF